MAQPPVTEVNETFLREVDENLRRDRVRDFFQHNKTVLIVALVLFLGASGGIIWWQDYRQQQQGQEVETLAEAFKAINDNQTASVPQRLAEASKSSSSAVRASALLTQAALALEKGDSASASKIYGAIAGDSSMPQPYRDAALLRQTTLEFDTLKPDVVISRLAPLATPGSPWFGSASEITAAALIKQGKRAEAGRLFAAIAKDKNSPESLRERSVQIAGSLGVDASDALADGAR